MYKFLQVEDQNIFVVISAAYDLVAVNDLFWNSGSCLQVPILILFIRDVWAIDITILST